MITGLYEMLTSDGGGKWSDASAQSYFLDGVESRILAAFYERCKFLRISGQGDMIGHISLQFGGSDVLISQMPADFKKSADDAIYRKTDFKVKLVENATNPSSNYY